MNPNLINWQAHVTPGKTIKPHEKYDHTFRK